MAGPSPAEGSPARQDGLERLPPSFGRPAHAGAVAAVDAGANSGAVAAPDVGANAGAAAAVRAEVQAARAAVRAGVEAGTVRAVRGGRVHRGGQGERASAVVLDEDPERPEPESPRPEPFQEEGRARWRALAEGSRMIKEAAPLLDPGRPGLRVLVLLGLLAAVVAGIYAWRSQPVADPVVPQAPSGTIAVSAGTAEGGTVVLPPGAAPAAAGASEVASPPPTPGVTVHVTGKVRKPGVLTLPSGSRVVDAIQAAGGARPGVSPNGLNLARRLVDGEQIVVGASAAPTGAAASAGTGVPTTISLTSATYAQLQELPGVGEVLAQRIIEYRDAHGGFQNVDQLQDVSGIGPQKFADLKDRVTP